MRGIKRKCNGELVSSISLKSQLAVPVSGTFVVTRVISFLMNYEKSNSTWVPYKQFTTKELIFEAVNETGAFISVALMTLILWKLANSHSRRVEGEIDYFPDLFTEAFDEEEDEQIKMWTTMNRAMHPIESKNEVNMMTTQASVAVSVFMAPNSSQFGSQLIDEQSSEKNGEDESLPNFAVNQ